MKKKLSVLLCMALCIGLMSGCSESKQGVSQSSGKKLKVITSFNAMADIAKEIGKDKIEVITMVPKGSEAHDFELKPKDMASINEGNVFIYNGLDMESWADDVLNTINKDITVVKASDGCNLIKNHEEDNDDEGKSEEHVHGEYDPHVWLSLSEVKTMAHNIADGLSQADKDNSDYYNKNYEDFCNNADSLMNEYKEKFASVTNKDFITGHEAFAYLCRDFGLTQKGIAGVFNDGEVTSVKLAEVVNYCKKNNIKTIFAEKDGSSKVTDTVANEIDGRCEEINTLESEGEYFDAMKENLEKIYSGLK